VNSNVLVSFHHTMAMKYRLEDDEIERQLSARYVTSGSAFLGVSRSSIQRRESVR
jgi:hypothetical protein